MFSIVKKEINSFLDSLIAYIFIIAFLALTGLFVWVYADTNVLDYGFADLRSFFSLTPYLFLLLIPAITMRSFAEEFKSGTIELLFTKPLTDWQILLGKYFAALILVIVALIPTFLYVYSVYQLGNPVGNIDMATVWGAYIGLLLLAAIFVAIGIFASSLTDNQVIAFVIAAAIGYVMYDGIHQLAQLFNGQTQFFIDYLGLSFHYESLGRGLVDTRNVIYLLSITFLLLLLTKINIKRKL